MSQRYATVTLSTDMTWDDGTPFDGFLVFQVVMPAQAQLTGTNGNIISGSPTLAASQPSVFVPLWHVLPVVGGRLASNARIWKNSAYNPRGTKYKLFAFDAYMTHIRDGKVVWSATEEEELIIAHHCDMKRIQIFDGDSGEMSYTWQKNTGEDHYHHAHLYAFIAAKIRGLSSMSAHMPFFAGARIN